MPRVKFKGLQGNEAEQESGFSTYDGPPPPVGIYTVRLKNLYLTTNKNGEDYMYGFCEIAESGAKEKFNGYSLRVGQNITPQGAGYVNKMLDALEIPRKVFWTQGVVTSNESDPPQITKIGKVKIGDNLLRVQTKKDPYGGDEDRLGIVTYLPLREDEEEEEYDEDEYEDEEDEEPEDDDAYEDEDEEDEEYDDEEEEPEPPKKRVAKKAPAKKAPAKKAPAKKAAPAKSSRRRKPEPEPDDYEDADEEEYEDEEDPF